MEIVKLNGPLAARVTGIDWDAGLRDADVDEIADALFEHGVLVIAAGGMRPEQHVQLAASFGELEHHEFFENQGPGLEHITVLDSARGDRSNMWHIDEQFLEKPPISPDERHLRVEPLKSFPRQTCYSETDLCTRQFSSRAVRRVNLRRQHLAA